MKKVALIFLFSFILMSCGKYKGKWELAGTPCKSCGTSYIYLKGDGIIANGEPSGSPLYFKGNWKETDGGIEVTNSNKAEDNGFWEFRVVDGFGTFEKWETLISPGGAAFRKQ
jgi:hypothetical protein